MRSIEEYNMNTNKWNLLNCFLAYDLECYSLAKASERDVFIFGGKRGEEETADILLFNAES